MFKFLSLIYTSKDKNAYELATERPEVSLTFLTNFLSYEDRKSANLLNRFIPGKDRLCVRDKLCWKLAFFLLPKKQVFEWNNSYIKKSKEEDLGEFKEKLCRHFGWTEREWKLNKKLVLKEKEYYSDLLGVDNITRKKLGVEKVVIPKAPKVEEVTIRGLSEWS